MRNLGIGILLISLVLLKPALHFYWQAWYLINFDYVATELCENKDEPKSCCQGSCYIKKQVEQVEVNAIAKNEQNKSNTPASSKIFKVDIQYYLQESEHVSFQHVDESLRRGTNPHFYKDSNFCVRIDHPPCV